MKVLTPGHKYELAQFEEPGLENFGDVQTIQFIEKVPVGRFGREPGSGATSELKTVNGGTTNEEVLAVLIDRLNFLNGKFPCRENSLAITKLQEAKMWLEERMRGRVARGVEGKPQA